MPNHITNMIIAGENVINHLLDNETQEIDFNKVLPMPDDIKSIELIPLDAEQLAELICGEEGSRNILIRMLESNIRSSINALNLSDESFDCMIDMLKNKRKHGFYHCLDFSRKVWGTKWNAYNQSVNINGNQSKAKFDTAWSHPFPVIKKLSEQFPEEEIKVNYASEDIGYDCGFYSITNGQIKYQRSFDEDNTIGIADPIDWINFGRSSDSW